MPKRKTTEQFISEARKIHGDRYDYSKVQYVNAETPVEIRCKEHGVFKQAPKLHIGCYKCGCPKCARVEHRKSMYGVGNIYRGEYNPTIYSYWKNMISRCTLKTDSLISYSACEICDEWLSYEAFEKWVNRPESNYHEKYELDKDILSGKNKIYSPQTCVFVPKKLNMLLVKRKRGRGVYPIGVSYDKSRNKYYSHLGKKYLGRYQTPWEAFQAYKQAKEAHIKEVAIQYFKEHKINERVYNALMSYEVEITD